MSRALLVELAQRTLAHARAGTVPLAANVVEVPANTYLDPDRWAAEIERIWRRVPLVFGPSADLPEPHSYRALDIAGVPVLLTRGDDGTVQAFINSCSHRGAIVVEEGSGSARRFTCPFHAWTYDGDGALVGIFDREDFGDVDLDCRGLTPLPCEERAGLVFGQINPEASLDLDSFLQGYDDVLNVLGLAECHVAGRQEVAGPNWKVAFDGYLDFYHLPILHKNSFGPDYSNKAVFDAWGPHQRLQQPDHRVLALDDNDPDNWTVPQITGGVFTIFPNISVASFDAGGRLFMISVLLPGASVGESITAQYFLSPSEPDAEQEAAIAERMDFLLNVVRDEDYATGLGIQRGLAARPKETVLFGRNEGGGQRFHRWVDALVEADDEAAGALFASADTDFAP
ncbi:MAG: phenylpropionate dioxygenase-like ring-hydroxylating dioxygenase large terminal subunit [Candidatus Aldehydirespiratoraceae bacterium]|jgi:phenylpropionate dioxygenase-like ring-hydroxylating dioxygenase large terminal subunit